MMIAIKKAALFAPAALFLAAALLAASCRIPEPEPNARVPYDPHLDGWRPASWQPFDSADTITGFAFGEVLVGGRSVNRYVAVSDTGRIGWSADGDRWFLAASDSPPGGLRSVTFGDSAGVFVAVGDGGRFARSLDGESWLVEAMQGFDGEGILGVGYGNGVFVAVGANARISVSLNGMDWAGGMVPAFFGAQLNDVAFCDLYGRFFVVGNGGNRGWSDDPADPGEWMRLGPTPPIGAANITRVAVGRLGNGDDGDTRIGIGLVAGGHVAVASGAYSFAGFIPTIANFMFRGNSVNGLAWGGRYVVEEDGESRFRGNFVSAGTSAMIGYWPGREPDRDSERWWRALPLPEFMLWEITEVAALNGRFFVGSTHGGRIAHSR